MCRTHFFTFSEGILHYFRRRHTFLFPCVIKQFERTPFKLLYDTWKEKRVPSPEIMQDTLGEGEEMSSAHRKECVELFMENAKFLGLLRTVNGSERLITVEHL